MSVNPNPRHLSAEVVRRLAKRQPREKKVKQPGKARTVQIVKKRSGGLCERCGAQGHSTHHRVNVSQGGQWTPQNCVRLCGSGTTLCHGWVTVNPNAAHKEGFHLESTEAPGSHPIHSAVHGVVYLTDDGRVLPVGGEQ